MQSERRISGSTSTQETGSIAADLLTQTTLAGVMASDLEDMAQDLRIRISDQQTAMVLDGMLQLIRNLVRISSITARMASRLEPSSDVPEE